MSLGFRIGLIRATRLGSVCCAEENSNEMLWHSIGRNPSLPDTGVEMDDGWMGGWSVPARSRLLKHTSPGVERGRAEYICNFKGDNG